MHRLLLLFAALICLGGHLYAQETPQLLHDAVSCLSAKEFLPSLKSRAPRFGYWVDTRSYPGEKAMYVVEYPSTKRSRGWVFTIFMSRENGQQVLDIQNNARFVRTKKDALGVDFVEPPLGGVGTQEYIIAAIKTIETQDSFVIPAKEFAEIPSPLGCESYADKK